MESHRFVQLQVGDKFVAMPGGKPLERHMTKDGRLIAFRKVDTHHARPVIGKTRRVKFDPNAFDRFWLLA